MTVINTWVNMTDILCTKAIAMFDKIGIGNRVAKSKEVTFMLKNRSK